MSILVSLLACAACASHRSGRTAPARPIPFAAADPAPGPFDGCAATAQLNGFLYQCGPVIADIADWRDITPEGALDAHLVGIRTASLPGQMHEEWTTLMLAGHSVRGVRIVIGPADDPLHPLFVGQVAALAGPQGGTRIMSCGAQSGDAFGLERCEKVLEYLAGQGPPPKVPVKPAPPAGTPAMMLDRQLALPDGCQVAFTGPDGSTLTCPSAEFSWKLLEPPPTDMQFLDDMMAALTRNVKVQGDLMQEEVACSIEKVTATCHRLVVKTSDGRALVYMGAAQVKGQWVLVYCSFVETSSALHPVCAQVLRTQ
ncbi:MAG TPA: hypothetical protein VKN99_07480 [Polyangia bacterium]|nr:hypothetical protein [Polyangia bacterium]